MQPGSGLDDTDLIDPSKYLRIKEENEDKRDEFMRKHLHRAWPVRVLLVLGIFQLLVSLTIVGVDLPIILMFGPRWQVFAGCWTFVFGLLASITTLHSIRKTTWSKLKWATAMNIFAGLAAAVMVAFDILFLTNSNICVVAGGCNYLWYTYSAAKPFYVGQVIVGIALLIAVFIFLIIFIKYGVGGKSLFDDIQNGRAEPIYDPIVSSDSSSAISQQPAPGAGVAGATGPRNTYIPTQPAAGPGVAYAPRPAGPMMMPGQRPPGPMMMPGQRPPGPMMMPGQRPPGPMMMPGQRPPGPMMIPGQRPPGPMMMPGQRPPGPMMMPGQQPPMAGYYGQPAPVPYPFVAPRQ